MWVAASSAEAVECAYLYPRRGKCAWAQGRAPYVRESAHRTHTAPAVAHTVRPSRAGALSTVSSSPRPSARTLAELASWLWEREPACGSVRLVGVDGHAGSGKSTLSDRLSAATAHAPVLHLDDLARHEEFFSWTQRLRDQVLVPLERGHTARYEVYDWVRRRTGRVAELSPAPLVLVEGVGAGRRALRPYLSAVLWMDLPPETAWKRGLRRDGAELVEFWQRWTAEERAHFATDPTLPFAHHVIRQSTTADGFAVFPGPQALPTPEPDADSP